MGTYAVIKDNVVINRIIAENKEIAESVTGQTCVECDGSSVIGGSCVDGVFGGPLYAGSEESDDIEITDTI